LAETTSRPRIVLLVGLPGSGKSTWVQSKVKLGKSGVLSSDALRELLADDPNNQNIHARIFRVMRDLLKHRLQLERPVTYIDATNLTPKERRPYIKLANSFDCAIEAVLFDVPAEECIRRNRGRGRIVPGDVIRKMAQKLVPPDAKEGFSRVSVVRQEHD
jgi:predicted kinase